jgi:2',3'-cyclic-nucleotide 2'-phosphodiesterase
MAGLRILFLGDLVGVVGLTMLKRWLPKLVEQYSIDASIVNGENVALKGRGIHPNDAKQMFDLGVKVITTGNHVFALREIYPYLNNTPNLVRPANFPDGTPGRGFVQVEVKGVIVTVVNLMGRTFFRETLACPFKKADEIIAAVRTKSSVILVDFHAEATSEKIALGLYLDGRISAIVGTHTHVQTADERILPQGTGYITDLGSSCSVNSCLGVDSTAVIQRFITQLPHQFLVDTKPPYQLTGLVVEIDRMTGKTTSIERVKIIDDQQIY